MPRFFAQILAVAALAAIPVRALAECRPAVSLQGPADLTTALARTLQERGITGANDPSCPELRARVERRGERIAVEILEVASPRSQRDFASADLAATYIESWTRSDVSAGLLESLPAPMPAPPAPPPPARPALPRLFVDLAGTLAVDTDGELWAGGVFAGCGRVGPVCIGATVLVRGRVYPTGPKAILGDRGSLMPPVLPKAATLGLAGRSEYAALMMVRAPLRLRSIILTPGAGLGVGFIDNLLVAAQGDPTVANPEQSRGQTGGRGRLELRLTAPLRLGLGIDVGVSGDLAFGGTGSLAAVVGDAGGMPPIFLTGVPALSVPAATFGLSIGLSFAGVAR